MKNKLKKNRNLKRNFLKSQCHFDFCSVFHFRPSWKWLTSLMDFGKIKFKRGILTYVLICSYLAFRPQERGIHSKQAH